MNNSELNPEVSIKYDFLKDRRNPAEVFEAMALYINSYRDLTQLLSNAVGLDCDVELKLNDVEKGSLLSKLSSIKGSLSDILEEKLYQCGDRLFKELIPKIETKTEEDVDYLALKLEEELSENFQDQLVPPCIDRQKLAYVLESISNANKKTAKGETVNVIQNRNNSEGEKLNTDWRFTGVPKNMFKGKTEPKEHVDLLVITVAVYVGRSVWSFKSLNSEMKFSAKITHAEWLSRYQAGFIQPIGPKDVIEAEIKYDLYTPPPGKGQVQIRNAQIERIIDIHRNDSYQHAYPF